MKPLARLLPILLPLIPLGVVAAFGYLAVRTFWQRRAAEADPQIRVESLTDDTVLERDGSVRSVQAGDVWLPSDRLEAVWTAENLERLARTYWYHLGRISFRLLRVMYTPTGRAMALFGLVPLITFDEPEYELDERHGSVKWTIRNGLLVSQKGADKAGYLGIVVKHLESDRPGMDRLHVELSIVNFYPALADRLSKRLYTVTQSRIHVVVVYSFLRSLAHGQLVPSKVGRFAQWPKELGIRLDERREAKEAAKAK
ncbi:MAG: hypothetical protein Q7T55_20160 [Solirubrobacteraceae bacterium]|nr:hypothetical protein [Solirubrobacteraceae bacterium]